MHWFFKEMGNTDDHCDFISEVQDWFNIGLMEEIKVIYFVIIIQRKHLPFQLMENNANVTSTSIDYKICLKYENIMVSHEKHTMKNALR